jgi:uncharacterized protein YyaL (SSP411 family)
MSKSDEAAERPRRECANKLGNERSPYLLQHADNPVDWYPWGAEAFEMARKQDKPIFLSIGYSTCHWCHVMERESFEDPEVARLMNDTFVCVKVDREERPDIDNIYMTVCQMMTGSGGWPLTIIMTPSKVPFFATTYVPKTSRFGRIGMIELIPQIKNIWATRRDDVTETAAKITAALVEISSGTAGSELDRSVLETGYEQLAGRFDALRGGFGGAPKFPMPHNLLFLLRYWRRNGDTKALSMVETTLEMMRRGGIYDHVGFGFHRYSTDKDWLVPHFEKMLYDQALLAMAYTEAYQATHKSAYAETAQEIVTYVLRDMTSPEGGFYSAEDADSEGEEGRFYIWTADEISEILGEKAGDLIARVYNVKKHGNFRDEATGSSNGANILHLESSLAELAVQAGMTERDLVQQIDTARLKLFNHRRQRVHPHKDDKILTDWNGLMIAALAKSGAALDRTDFTYAARGAADFILERLLISDDRLLHRYRDGEAGIADTLNDYAFFIWGLIELYEACQDVRYLEAALRLTRSMMTHFWDDEHGGLYFTPDDGEDLLVRRKEVYDGALPSGNSVAMLNLLRLAAMTGQPDLAARASDIGKAFSAPVREVPIGNTQLLVALDFAVGLSYEVVIVGDPDGDDTKAMLKALRSTFLPNKVVLLKPEGAGTPITRLASFTGPHSTIDGKATAYVCRNQACELPTTDPGQMLNLMDG